MHAAFLCLRTLPCFSLKHQLLPIIEKLRTARWLGQKGDSPVTTINQELNDGIRAAQELSKCGVFWLNQKLAQDKGLKILVENMKDTAKYIVYACHSQTL